MEKNGYGLYSQGSSGWTSMRNEEFHEGDVWGVFDERKDSDTTTGIGSFTTKRIQTAPATIIQISNNVEYSCTSKESGLIVQHSSPIKIHDDWSKIYGTNSNDIDADSDGDDDGFVRSEEEDDEEEYGGANVIPPHEWVANYKMSSSSVCEGAGRTLKGRDLSRGRNDVLTRTGFPESNPHYY